MKLLVGSVLLCGCVGASTSSNKRDVITDLSGGWCRSYKFGTNIAGDVLRLIDLDGGLLPADGDGDNSYLIELPLTEMLNLDEGSTYHMRLVDPAVPKLKGQAFWSNSANDTLFTYGGQALSNVTSGDGAWLLSVNDGSWRQQASSIKPVRLEQGASVNAPEVQAGYWVGGFHSTGVSTAANQQTQEYASGMLVFNTTTQEASQVDAPIAPVQNGALIYLPYGDRGVLLFLGGEKPASANGQHLDEEAVPYDWSNVYVYDIAADRWYKQPTTGATDLDRTQFCAVAVHDDLTETHQIWVMGGASYSSKEALVDVSNLSIPSFKWYPANPLSRPRMTHSCQVRGRQMFAVGGRVAWADDERAGCYKMPAVIYDLVDQAENTMFDPAAPPYVALKGSTDKSEPETWGDLALQRIFAPSSSDADATTDADDSDSATGTSKARKGLIAGLTIGISFALTAILTGTFCFLRYKRRRHAPQQIDIPVWPTPSEQRWNGTKPAPIPAELEVRPAEMEAAPVRHELMGDIMWSKKRLPELPGDRTSRQSASARSRPL